MAKRKQVSDVEFVNAWMKSSNYAEVLDLLGMAKQSIQARAAHLRKVGVKLPKYGRQRRMVDVKGLNELIAKAKKRG